MRLTFALLAVICGTGLAIQDTSRGRLRTHAAEDRAQQALASGIPCPNGNSDCKGADATECCTTLLSDVEMKQNGKKRLPYMNDFEGRCVTRSNYEDYCAPIELPTPTPTPTHSTAPIEPPTLTSSGSAPTSGSSNLSSEASDGKPSKLRAAGSKYIRAMGKTGTDSFGQYSDHLERNEQGIFEEGHCWRGALAVGLGITQKAVDSILQNAACATFGLENICDGPGIYKQASECSRQAVQSKINEEPDVIFISRCKKHFKQPSTLLDLGGTLTAAKSEGMTEEEKLAMLKNLPISSRSVSVRKEQKHLWKKLLGIERFGLCHMASQWIEKDGLGANDNSATVLINVVTNNDEGNEAKRDVLKCLSEDEIKAIRLSTIVDLAPLKLSLKEPQCSEGEDALGGAHDRDGRAIGDRHDEGIVGDDAVADEAPGGVEPGAVGREEPRLTRAVEREVDKPSCSSLFVKWLSDEAFGWLLGDKAVTRRLIGGCTSNDGDTGYDNAIAHAFAHAFAITNTHGVLRYVDTNYGDGTKNQQQRILKGRAAILKYLKNMVFEDHVKHWRITKVQWQEGHPEDMAFSQRLKSGAGQE